MSGPPLGEPIRLVVGPEHHGVRVDRFLARRLRRSRAAAAQLVRDGAPRVAGGRALEASSRVRTGEVVLLEVPLGTPEPPLAAEIAAGVRVLYEDDDLLAVDKPAGLPMHPAGRWVERSLVRLLRARLGEGAGAPAHRLDRNTSGVVLFLRTALARSAIGRDLRARRVGKLYLAVTVGAPARRSGVIDAPIGLDAASGIAVRRAIVPVAEGGAEASTRWRVLGRSGPLALVAAAPRTGRAHQIRVHLAALGAPLAGDPLYGSDPGLYLALRTRAPTPAEWAALRGLRRHALHAAVLRIAHPRTGRALRLTSPLPAELLALL